METNTWPHKKTNKWVQVEATEIQAATLQGMQIRSTPAIPCSISFPLLVQFLFLYFTSKIDEQILQQETETYLLQKDHVNNQLLHRGRRT